MIRPTPFDRHFARDIGMRLDFEPTETVEQIKHRVESNVLRRERDNFEKWLKSAERACIVHQGSAEFWRRFAFIMTACFILCAIAALCMAVWR